MIRIGLTGGIGSGKSTVSKIFQVIGIPVYEADSRARKLMLTDPLLRDKIKAAFGERAYSGGNLNRSYLADIVFSNEEKLRQLNEIVHPAVIRDFGYWTQEQSAFHYVIHEAAILFESGAYKGMDYNINVHADRDLRLKRVVKRDNTLPEKVLQRMDKQMGDKERSTLADFQIHNNDDDILIPQVIDLHNKFVSLQT